MKKTIYFGIASLLFITASAFLPLEVPSKTKKPDYSKLIGTWVDPRPNEATGAAAIFTSKGTYSEYLFYDKDEKLKPGTQPKSTVWTGIGTYSVSYDVLVIRITGTSDNMSPFNKSFHFVKFEKDEMILLNTAGGKRTTWKKIR